MSERDARVHSNPVLGDKAVFLKTADETGGEYTLIELELAPRGKGAPLHFHQRYAETFRVLEGELRVRVGKQSRTLAAGEEVVAAPSVPHAFSNPSDRPVRFTAEMRPASPGFEASLKIAYGLARDGELRPSGVPKKLAHLALLVDISEGSTTGAAALFEPILRWVARRARRRGVEAELRRKYC